MRANPFALFGQAFRKQPLRTCLGMLGQYATFFAAVGFALALFLTRVPLRWFDHLTGLRVRERAVDVIGRISPG
jgi:hypothetical protein